MLLFKTFCTLNNRAVYSRLYYVYLQYIIVYYFVFEKYVTVCYPKIQFLYTKILCTGKKKRQSNKYTDA